jgi:D-alanyl-D-alanine carboxypeptidase
MGERLPDLPDAWADVTLRQLLNHTSGVPDFIHASSFADAVGESLGQAPLPEELLAFVEDQPLTFPAGSHSAYSNSDNIAVGLMIESATGQPYPDVLAEQVLEPLGLSETSLPEGVEIPEPFIHGYAIENGGAPEDVSNLLAAGWAWASGGVVSTPNDLNDFIRGYVSGAPYEHPDVRAEQQELFIPGGGSEPPGPGFNSAPSPIWVSSFPESGNVDTQIPVADGGPRLRRARHRRSRRQCLHRSQARLSHQPVSDDRHGRAGT